MTDRLAGIAAFVQAAEAGSFALAANRLHLTRSAVGKSIARLEERLGTRLFLRTTRRQTLTADGQAFYEHCTRALAELDAGEAALSAARRSPQGRLHVSAPVLFGRRCVAPVLCELVARFPKLELQMSFTDRLIDLVDENVDLVLRSGPLRNAPADLVARKLGEQTMRLCASPGYLARHGTPKTIAQLEGHHGVLYATGRRDAAWPLSDDTGDLSAVTMKHRLRFDDLETIVAAVKSGAGIARLPCWLVADEIKEGSLVPLMANVSGPRIDVHLAWRRARHLPTRVRVAIDLLTARLPAVLAVGGDTRGA